MWRLGGCWKGQLSSLFYAPRLPTFQYSHTPKLIAAHLWCLRYLKQLDRSPRSPHPTSSQPIPPGPHYPGAHESQNWPSPRWTANSKVFKGSMSLARSLSSVLRHLFSFTSQSLDSSPLLQAFARSLSFQSSILLHPRLLSGFSSY